MEELKEELKELRQKKQDLIDKGMQIRDQLAEFETYLKNNKKTIFIESAEPLLSTNQSAMSLNSKKTSLNQLNAATRQITGIVFKDVNKKWLKDHIWLYEMTVVLKVIQFQMFLTINKKNLKENEILDIKCTLSNIEQCYLNELTPWIDTLTKLKNFTHLMSAFSEYNDQNIFRMKILNKLESKKIVTIKESTEEGGGLIAYVHDSHASKKIYVKFNWRLQLNPQTTSIDHIFDIDGIDNEFVTANEEIFKNFCKRGLKKNELEKLWYDLCVAINEYKQ
ncbi:uncharacterized protein [Chelonus insularis]|uniref:uncharacterized protein n=1 Tax=Chelonus insularis TaxID=460826 RepID=UPI001588CBA6|nr:uncharacterized protein LOC118065417 [Chelonus insularis]